MSAGGKRWAYVRETLLALAVIALIFLNFGHVSVTASGEFQIVPDSWCGDPLLPDSPTHAPCHACRVDGATLPPPPAEIAPVCFTTVAVAYEPLSLPFAGPVARSLAQPRGPPSLV
jgi:hypothetical protein